MGSVVRGAATTPVDATHRLLVPCTFTKQRRQADRSLLNPSLLVVKFSTHDSSVFIVVKLEIQLFVVLVSNHRSNCLTLAVGKLLPVNGIRLHADPDQETNTTTRQSLSGIAGKTKTRRHTEHRGRAYPYPSQPRSRSRTSVFDRRLASFAARSRKKPDLPTKKLTILPWPAWL